MQRCVSQALFGAYLSVNLLEYMHSLLYLLLCLKFTSMAVARATASRQGREWPYINHQRRSS